MFWSLLSEKKFLNYSANGTLHAAKYYPSLDNLIVLSLIPIICIFGAITNGLNILVFLNPKMKDPSFKFMLAISIANFLYNSLLSYGFIIYCDECKLNKNFGTQVFKILINNYTASCLTVFVTLVEIYLSIQRYFILINKRYLQNLTIQSVMLTILAISLVYNVPVLFCYDILSLKTFDSNLVLVSSLFSTKLSKFGKSVLG